MVFQTLILLIIVLNKVLIKNKLSFVQFTIPYSEKFWRIKWRWAKLVYFARI